MCSDFALSVYVLCIECVLIVCIELLYLICIDHLLTCIKTCMFTEWLLSGASNAVLNVYDVLY